MKYAVSDNGIRALFELAESIRNAIYSIEAETKKVEWIAETYPDTLGPHKESLDRTLEEIKIALYNATEPAEELSEMIEEVAEGYQDILDHDLINIMTSGSSGAGGVSSTVAAAGAVAAGAAIAGAAAMGTASNPQSGESSFAKDKVPHQTKHKDLLLGDAAVAAIASDIANGSGKAISTEHAREIYESVQNFTGERYPAIRGSYNNPKADPRDIRDRENFDEYINNSPKWKGQVFRGINVSKKVLNNILSGGPIDMLGTASWSSEEDVANRFAEMYTKKKGENVVFVLPENKSGVSVTHISSYNGAEGEVTAPSGVKYGLDFVEEVKKGSDEFVYVYVHELGE